MNSPKVIQYDLPVEETTEVIDGVETPKIIYDQLSVTVYPANGVMGMRRHRLRYEQSKVDDADQDSRLLRLTTYPDLVACADIAPTFEQFAAMPDAFLSQWEDACYDLNPHWLDIGANEKKATT